MVLQKSSKEQKSEMLENSMKICGNLDILLYNFTTYLIQPYINLCKVLTTKHLFKITSLKY